MDTKSFLKEIRSIIREEIDYALDKRLKKQQKPVEETVKHGVSLYKEALQGAVKKKPVQKQSSNSKLTGIQDILEQTRRSLQESTHYDEEFGGTELSFTTDSLNAFARPSHGAIPQGVDPNELTPEVANALTRDYSALMAKINEKKGV